jgi:hypothetical protein
MLARERIGKWFAGSHDFNRNWNDCGSGLKCEATALRVRLEITTQAARMFWNALDVYSHHIYMQTRLPTLLPLHNADSDTTSLGLFAAIAPFSLAPTQFRWLALRRKKKRLVFGQDLVILNSVARLSSSYNIL